MKNRFWVVVDALLGFLLIGCAPDIPEISGLLEAERANLSSDWHLDEIPFLPGPTNLDAPLTLLYVDGSPQYA